MCGKYSNFEDSSNSAILPTILVIVFQFLESKHILQLNFSLVKIQAQVSHEDRQDYDESHSVAGHAVSCDSQLRDGSYEKCHSHNNILLSHSAS